MTKNQWIMFGVAKVLLIAIGIAIVFSMYGCNTVQGIGQDIKNAGEAIERSTR